MCIFHNTDQRLSLRSICVTYVRTPQFYRVHIILSLSSALVAVLLKKFSKLKLVSISITFLRVRALRCRFIVLYKLICFKTFLVWAFPVKLLIQDIDKVFILKILQHTFSTSNCFIQFLKVGEFKFTIIATWWCNRSHCKRTCCNFTGVDIGDGF